MKILISTDTSCLVNNEMLKKYDISVFPLNVIIDGEEFLDGVKALGIEMVDLHVSGHADRQTIGRLIRKTCPKEIIMVHCEK